jgi:hypothetical protein
MASLAIALPGGGGGPRNLNGPPLVAPRSRRCSGGCAVPPLGIGVQAIQLSPYHAGLAGRHLWRLPVAPASRACCCPLRLSPLGEPDGPETSLRVSPDCVRDSAPRSAAHRFDASGSSMKQRAARHAVSPLGLEGHLHGTRAGPAPEMLRWWQPHQQGPLRSRRHLCFAAQSRLAVLSRASTPEGSLPPFGRGAVARRLNPYPTHYRPAFASSLLLYPLPHRLALRLTFPGGRATGLPRSAGGTDRVV